MMIGEKQQHFGQSGYILPDTANLDGEWLGIKNIDNLSTGLTIELSNIQLNQDTAAATGISDVMPPDVMASENSDRDPPPGQDITGMPSGSAIAFIDETVSDYQSLIAGIKQGTEVIVLDSETDGVAQITAALAQRENISSVHILGHGNAGSMQLGDSILDSNTLGQWAPRLQQWSASLSSGADILLYGCNVGFGTEGVAFVNQLSQLTGADIAASDDLTGSSALGGDWDLEVNTGNIEASLAFEAGALAAYESVFALIDNTTAQWTANTPLGNNNFYLNNNFSAAGNPLTGAIDGGPVEYRTSDGMVVNSYNNFGDGAKSALELGSHIFFAGDNAQGIRRIDNDWLSNLTGYQATVEGTESITTDGTSIYGNDDVNRDRIIKWSVNNNPSDFSLNQVWARDVGTGGRFRGISYFDHSAATGDEYIYASDGGAGGSTDKIWAFDATFGADVSVKSNGTDITVPGTEAVYQAIVHEVGGRTLLMAVTTDNLYVWDMDSPTTTISTTPTEIYSLSGGSDGQLFNNGGGALGGQFYGAGARGNQLFLLHGDKVSAYQLSATSLPLSTEVTNTDDSGTGSLRQALTRAAVNPGADTITFTGPTFTDATADIITLTSELTYLGGAGNDLTIQAPGNSRLTINGGGSSGVFNINSSANVTLDGLTITGGDASDSGGGINNIGTGTLTVLNSTIFNNTANNLGGGIFNGSSSTAILTNSTISGNQANSTGGGIDNSGTLTINNSTITGNNATSLGGGINNGGTANVNNTIVAGNTDASGAPDVLGTFTSNNSNLIGDTTTATGFSMSEDIVGAVGSVINTTLAPNGGTTETHALVTGSPAIDAGNNTDVPGGITTDQRGTGFDRIFNGTVDIGAYELQPNIAISSPAIAAASVPQGTTDHILYQLDLAVTAANAQLTGATFTTGGTYVPADIVANSFELFYSTDTTFDAGTDTSLGNQAAVTSGSNLAFTGLSQAINSGTTGTLFLVADIATGATLGNTINIAAPMLSDITFAAGDKTGTPIAGGAQTFAPNLVISEIMFDPASADSAWEWVEIYNAGSTTVNLSGYVLDDINTNAHSSANIASGTLAAGQTAILFDDDSLDISNFEAAWGTGINLIGVTGWGNIGLNNNGDTVSLWDSFTSYSGDHTTHANAIDTVDYSTAGFPDPTGASIYLTTLNADNSNGSNWATSTDGGTTPAGNGYTSANAGGNSGNDIGSPGGSLPVIAISSTAIPAASVVQGTTNHPLYQLDLAVTTANTQLTGATFTTGGSYVPADIVLNSFELFYSTDTTFDGGDTSLGTKAVVPSGNNLAFTGLSQTINSGTTGTLFLVADIATGATAGNDINIAAPTLGNITFNAGRKTGTPTIGGTQTFDAIPTITSINSSTSNGTFGVGGNVNVTVNFSENVTLVGGNLTVNLDTGGAVNISPFANSNTASGTYTVGAGENSADLNSNSPLVLAGGAMLQDTTGNNVTLTIPGGQSLADNKDIIIDTTAPGAPSTPDMTAATDTGSSDSDNITNDTTPTFTGTAVANSTVTLISSVDGTVGTTTADGAGNWTITASTLSEGAQNITATATDAVGNVSSPSSALPIIIDTTAPTVTINQGGSQADPTAAAPINFTVLFNEPVTDFITGDVTLGGTASGTLTGAVSETAPNDGTTYNVAVNGMTGSGTVIASLGAGVAMDLAGNANAASTSTDDTVTFNANSAPVLDLNGGASGIDYSETFIRGGGEVAIVDSANLTVTDDGANLTGAMVTITNLQDGANEVLTVDTSGTSISFNYNSGTGVLNLSGSDTVANYQQVLRTVKYNNTFVTPNTTARAIEFLVNDGSVNSTTATTAVNITSPTINLGTISGPTYPPIGSISDSNPDNIYNLTLGATSQLVVELVTPFGNTDLQLYDSSGNLLASSTNTGTTSERIDQSSLIAGNYLVRVLQGSAGVAVNYLLRMLAF